MSTDWSFQFLTHAGGLGREQLGSLFAEAERLGFTAPAAASGDIVGMAADGMGELRFDTLDGTLDWLSSDDGLVQLGGVGDELSISVHRRAGILPMEMGNLPDEPLFDVCDISVRSRVLSSTGREEIWYLIEHLLRAAFYATRAEFGYGLDEDSLDAMRSWLCVHKRVANGRLPPFVAWLTMVPAGSALAAPLAALAAFVDRPIYTTGSVSSLQATEWPWQSGVEMLTQMSADWRRLSHDGGCGAGSWRATTPMAPFN